MSKAKAPRVFVPLYKVDEEQRLVYGRITAEEQDKSGETMDYAKSKANFEKWSNDIHTASGGLSKGNVRVMHGLNVAGKLTELDFDDDSQSIEVCAKVVDDGEWQKTLEGCYTGFSVGGKYGKRWSETVDGVVMKKYEAIPNEVSLVDNPCVTSATFSLVKADGVEEDIEFQLPDDVKETLAKAEAPKAKGKKDAGEDAGAIGDDADAKQNEQVEEESGAPGGTKKDKVVEKAVAPVGANGPTNAEVAAKAEELLKADAEAVAAGRDWMDFIPAARVELAKAFPPAKAKDDKEADPNAKAKEDKASGAADKKPKAKATADDTGDKGDGEKAAKADHSVANRLSQKWTCTDGKQFEKKAEAEAHELTLLDDADRLAARLGKALDGDSEDDSIFSLDRIDDLHKAVLELEGPRDAETMEPLLEKGMYTVSRFANMLGDVAGLARSIKAEGVLEDGDGNDGNVSKVLTTQLSSFGDSFMTYAKQQVAELVAGIDVDATPRACYDYYYRAAGEGNDLAKHVVEVITAVDDEMEAVEEGLEKLAKLFGFAEATLEQTDDGEVIKLQKAFDDKLAKVTKVAEDAVGKVEELAKRLKDMEDTPLPRAPIVANLPGDGQFMGKAATTEEEKVAVLQDMIKVHGTDGLATMMIKAAQQTPQAITSRG